MIVMNELRKPLPALKIAIKAGFIVLCRIEGAFYGVIQRSKEHYIYV